MTSNIRKKSREKIREMPQNDKEDEFTKERMLGRAAEIHILSTINELAVAVFVDFVGRATFLHIRDNSPRCSVI